MARGAAATLTERGSPATSVWARRRARAQRLASEAPHAEEILATYADLLTVQERVAERVPTGPWLTLAGTGHEGPPRLRLDRLPVDELVPLFADFLSGAAELGTEVMQRDAVSLSGAPGADWRGLVTSALSGEGAEGAPFHVRAFAQPVATALALAEAHAGGAGGGRRCPTCGGPPVVGALQDLPDALGSLSLVCAVCGSSWRQPRLTCAHCGEADADTLSVHTAESLPWVRIDECRSCGRYLKSIDLRRRGDAVPLVDDLATVELDLWARERGMVRVHPNLFGL